MLVPSIRISRALASTLIYPENPIKAIAISETISVFGIFFTPLVYNKIFVLTVSIIYCPIFANYILDRHFKENEIYNQAEICFLLLFFLTNILNYYK